MGAPPMLASRECMGEAPMPRNERRARQNMPTRVNRVLTFWACGSCAAAACALMWILQALATATDLAPAPDARASEGWKPVWSDEFDGDAIDLKKWDFDLGNRLPSGQPGW